MIDTEEAKQCTPGVNVWLPMSTLPGPELVVQACASNALAAVVVSVWAACAVAPPASVAPVLDPGGNPVMELPGETPKSPVSTDGPVFVTVDAPSTAKLPACPRDGAVCANHVDAPHNTAMTAATIGEQAFEVVVPIRDCFFVTKLG